MKKLLLACVLALPSVTAANAETYNYACKVTGVEPNPNNTYLYSAKIDTAKNTITWRGTVYRNAKPIHDNCAKWCFGNRQIMLDTATQGVATLSVGGKEFDCDMVRP